MIVSQIFFILILLIAIYLFVKKARQILANIRLGKDISLADNSRQRWRNVFLLALGQKKMFRNPLVGVLHLFVYAGFIIINIEVLEIILDGVLGSHRLFAKWLGGFYIFLINSFEILAVLVIASCSIFLIRRNIIKLKRFVAKDLSGWPRSDANYILITEIVLMSLFLIMNATDSILQSREAAAHQFGPFVFSQFLQPLFSGFNNNTLHFIERMAWWLHITGIFAFLNYLPYSKHLHIILAFPNAYFSKLDPMGKMENMPNIQNEVLMAMQPELATANTDQAMDFGAKDVTGLSWKNLLDAYSCTECGRCSAACPANITGKLLSPRAIMMKTRDRLEEVGKIIKKNKAAIVDDGKTLLHNYITVEELRACTTCNACVQECPVSISPLDIILQLRRNLIMDESNSPQEWNAAFGNIENNFAPWKFSPSERMDWAKD